MKARIKDYNIGVDGKQRITLEVDEDCRELYDRLKDSDISLEIKKWHNKRSLEANSYCWVLANKIADRLQTSAVNVYRDAIKDIAGVSEVVCVQNAAVTRLQNVWESKGIGWQTETMDSKLSGCTNVILYYGSSTYDTRQMTALIDRLIESCKEMGIEYKSEDEIARLLEEWESREEPKH